MQVCTSDTAVQKTVWHTLYLVFYGDKRTNLPVDTSFHMYAYEVMLSAHTYWQAVFQSTKTCDNNRNNSAISCIYHILESTIT